MVHTFIEPDTYNAFENEAEQIKKCKEWGLLSEKASKSKAFFYKGNGLQVGCNIVGYVDKTTAVIELDTKQKHCIHPSYLKEMQASNYGQKTAAAAGEDIVDPEAVDPKRLEAEAQLEEAPPAIEAKLGEAAAETYVPESITTEEPKAEAPPKGKAKKEKPQKIQLPEEKVQMTATVKEFTTVPNNFSDNDDEVIIYEAVSIIDPEIEIGEAWSSHSATLKKLELEIGNTIKFECKIVAKKLTRHPIPYKINNPAKIQKEQS